MIAALLLGLLFSTEPPPPAPPNEIVYLPVRGEGAEAMDIAEGFLGAEETGGIRFRRSTAPPGALTACLSEGFADHVSRCIRGLLSPRPRSQRLVALVVDVSTVSNVTGSRQHNRYRLYCVGQRSIAVADLGDGLDRRRPSPQELERRRGPVRDCLVEAARVAPLEALQFDGGRAGPRWRLRWGSLAEDEPMARGSSAEHAMVRIEGRVADCRARARVVAVTQGERLRLNDRIELVQSCASSSERERHLSSMLNGLRSGSIARLYIGYDGGLRFLNPVTAAP